MGGGGEDFLDAPWDFLTFYLMMGFALLGAKGFASDGGDTIDGSWWG